MKQFIIYSCMMATLAAINACGNANTDSTKIAEKANDKKIDSAQKADTVSTANSRLAGLKPDASFAVTAADGGMMEVALGKMAVEKGKSSEIKKLGAMMVKDHSKANEELKAAAKAKNITLPTDMSDKCQKMVSDLSGKTGADFDKSFADLMVSDHKEDIDEFKKEADSGNDKEISTWAKNKIPTLEHHLMMAEQAKKMTDK